MNGDHGKSKAIHARLAQNKCPALRFPSEAICFPPPDSFSRVPGDAVWAWLSEVA